MELLHSIQILRMDKYYQILIWFLWKKNDAYRASDAIGEKSEGS